MIWRIIGLAMFEFFSPIKDGLISTLICLHDNETDLDQKNSMNPMIRVPFYS